MKRRFLLYLLLCLLANTLPAQNWIPLAPGDQFQYKHSDSVLISNVLQVDSQKTLPNGDLFFSLNRVVLDCDTCTAFPARLANQGQFLQKSMLRKNDGRWVFSGKRTFVFLPLAQPGEAWLFDTTQNLTATVLYSDAAMVLGEADSVKTIGLSDGTQILLSKNHGLVQFPDGNSGTTYDLAGIATRHLGEQLPGWEAFYDFEIGDVLQYERNEALAPGTPSNLYSLEKRRILNRYWDADTLVYAVELFSYRSFYWPGSPIPFPFYGYGIINWSIHPALAEPWTDGYPLQFFQVENVPNGEQGSRIYWVVDTTYGVSQLLGEYRMPYDWGGCALFKKPEGTEEEMLPCDGCGASFHRLHSVGLGLVSHTLSCFESWDYGHLTGWVKNGVEHGVLTPDSFFLVSTHEPLAIPVLVAPNPSAGDWTVLFPDRTPEALRFTLRDLQGRMLLEGDVPSGAGAQIIPGAKLEAGIYFLQLQGRNGTKVIKLTRN